MRLNGSQRVSGLVLGGWKRAASDLPQCGRPSSDQPAPLGSQRHVRCIGGALLLKPAGPQVSDLQARSRSQYRYRWPARSMVHVDLLD